MARYFPGRPSRPSSNSSRPSGGGWMQGNRPSRPSRPSTPAPSTPAPRPSTPSRPSASGGSSGGGWMQSHRPATPSRPSGGSSRPATTPSRPAWGGGSNQSQATTLSRPSTPASRPSTPSSGGSRPAWGSGIHSWGHPTQQTPGTLPNRDQLPPGPAQSVPIDKPAPAPTPTTPSAPATPTGPHAGEQLLEGSKYYIYNQGANAALDAQLKPWQDRYMEARSRALAGDYDAIMDMRNANDTANQLKNKYGYAADLANADIDKIKADIGYYKNDWSPRPGDVWYPGMQGGGTGTGSNLNGGGVNDYSQYIKAMQQAALDAQIADIEAAWKNAQAGYDYTAQQMAPGYQAARNQAAAQADVARRQFGEYAAASGLNSGAGAQAELASQAALQGALAGIDTKEAGAMAQLGLQRQQSANKYQAAITQAKASGNLELARQLYQEAVRVDGVLREQARYEAQMALQQQQMAMQQQQQALDNAYRSDYFKWQQEQAGAGKQWDLAMYLASLGDYGALAQLGVSPEEIQVMYSMGLMGGGGRLGGSGGKVGSTGIDTKFPSLAATQGGGTGGNPFAMVQQPWETPEQYQARLAAMPVVGVPTTPRVSREEFQSHLDDIGFHGVRSHGSGKVRAMGDTSGYDHNRVWGPGSPMYDMANGVLSVGESADLLETPDWYYQMTQTGPYSPTAMAAAQRRSRTGGGGGSDAVLDSWVDTGTVPTGPLDTGTTSKPDPILSITGGINSGPIVPTVPVLSTPNPGMGDLDQVAGSLGKMSMSPVLTQALTGDPVYDWYITRGY